MLPQENKPVRTVTTAHVAHFTAYYLSCYMLGSDDKEQRVPCEPTCGKKNPDVCYLPSVSGCLARCSSVWPVRTFVTQPPSLWIWVFGLLSMKIHLLCFLFSDSIGLETAQKSGSLAVTQPWRRGKETSLRIYFEAPMPIVHGRVIQWCIVLPRCLLQGFRIDMPLLFCAAHCSRLRISYKNHLLLMLTHSNWRLLHTWLMGLPTLPVHAFPWFLVSCSATSLRTPPPLPHHLLNMSCSAWGPVVSDVTHLLLCNCFSN